MPSWPWSKNREPEPPTNVRVVYSDGTEIPVELVYIGLDDDGCHQWQPVNVPPLSLGFGVWADVIPPRTSISFPMVQL